MRYSFANEWMDEMNDKVILKEIIVIYLYTYSCICVFKNSQKYC